MVVDISDVCDVRLKLTNYSCDSLASLDRIDRVQSESRLRNNGARLLEISKRYEVLIVIRSRASRVRHGEQCDLVSSRPHRFHGVKQICFCAAKPEVVLVAVENSHKSDLLPLRQLVEENRQQTPQDCALD